MSDERPNHDQPQAGAPGGWTPPPGPDLTKHAAAGPGPAPAFVPGVPAQPASAEAGHAAAPLTGPDGAWYGQDACAPGGYAAPQGAGLVPPAYGQAPAAQPYAAQQQYPGQPHAGHQPTQQHPGQQYPGQQYPGQQYPGQPAWAGAPAPFGGYGRPLPPLAPWGARVGALLIDSAIASGPFLVAYIITIIAAVGASGAAAAAGDGSEMPAAFGVGMGFASLILLATYAWSIGWVIFDRIIRQGRSGQSVGKRVVGLRLLSERTMLPPGPGLTLGREFAHIADGAAYIGYLWPLWDEKKQTFADKICSTVVVRA